MAKSFLDQVAETVLDNHKSGLEKVMIIFPNQRPCAELKKLLSSGITEDNSPEILSMEEFISKNSNIETLDELQLLGMLYKHYKIFNPEEEFGKFLPWGKMILEDYDEIERNLIDPNQILSNVEAAKRLEEMDAMGHELERSFYKLWEIYKELFHLLKNQLEAQGKGFEGMAYRKVAEMFSSSTPTLNSKYYFCGFNALNKAEELIILSLLKVNKATVLWDADAFYMNNNFEGGYFIRKAIKNLKISNPVFFGNRLSEEKKTIIICNTTGKVAQAKALGLNLESNSTSSNTAIVLSDEKMLHPVRYGLTENTPLNITIGLSLNHSDEFRFLLSWFNLTGNYNAEANGYYHKDVLALVEHSFIRTLTPEYSIIVSEEIRERQLSFVPVSFLMRKSGGQVCEKLFANKKEGLIQNTLTEILNLIVLKGGGNQDTITKITDSIHLIPSIFDEQDLSISTFKVLLMEVVNRIKIPVKNTTHPGEAITLTGALETRALYFDEVHIPDMVEGKWPATSPNNSFIPFDIRKHFELPTFDEQDALYAYIFYRLLQGANRIFLYYYEADSTEMSRYIRQLKYYLPKVNPNISIEERAFNWQTSMNETPEIVIPKTEKFISAINSMKGWGISPSSLNMYFTCPVKFAYSKVYKLEERKEVTEEFESREFGTLYHETMQALYKDFEGKNVTRAMVTSLRKEIDKCLNASVQESLKLKQVWQENRNLLNLETIKLLVEKTLDLDENYAPFKILALEEKLQVEIRTNDAKWPVAKLGGYVDRVDEKDGIVRIVDYKTGKVDKLQLNLDDPEVLPDNKTKEAIQTFMYAWMYHKTHGSPAIKASILPLKTVVQGYEYVNGEDFVANETEFQKIENLLHRLLNKLLDETEDMTQTSDLVVCGYCEFKDLCRR